MALTKEEKILDLLLTAAKTIKTTAGYRTNIGNYMYDWTDVVIPAGTELYCRMKYGLTQFDNEKYPIHKIHCNHLIVEFHCFIEKGSSTVTYIRYVRADIYKMIGTFLTDTILNTYGPLKFYPVNDEKFMLEGEDKKQITSGGIIIRIGIEYATTAWLVNGPEY